MNKIKQLFSTLNKVPNDKLLHFFYGTILSFVGFLLIGDGALVVVAAIAAAKELVWDKAMSKGNCDVKDFVYTVVPAIMMLIIKSL
jgi:hypothetical protein|tara:strand:+ start:30 stop:287 length:258 start_codon:yes stop_codon:yes gene_type:complete